VLTLPTVATNEHEESEDLGRSAEQLVLQALEAVWSLTMGADSTLTTKSANAFINLVFCSQLMEHPRLTLHCQVRSYNYMHISGAHIIYRII
jgi:hypothetical protein